MKTSSILRTAALVLAFAGVTVGAEAQMATTAIAANGTVMMAKVAPMGQQNEQMNAAVQMAEMAMVQGEEADATVRGAIERGVEQGNPEARVLRTVMTGEKWNVKLTELGLPKSEYRKGFVKYELGGEVVYQQVVVERPYFAAGDNAANYVVRFGAMRTQN